MKLIRQHLRAVSFAALLLIVFSTLIASLSGSAWMPSASAQNPPEIAVVNAASFIDPNIIAPDTISSVFGNFQTVDGQIHFADALPLPTVLGGVRITFNNVNVPLLFTSNGQINFIVPSALAFGTAQVNVISANNVIRTGQVTITPATPGIFSVTSNGHGVAVAQTTSDGVIYQNIYNPDGSARDVDAGTVAKPDFLILYATGVRHTPADNPNDGNAVAEAVTLTIEGVPTQVFYAGNQHGFAGLDQINVRIPPTLAGLGSVLIKLTTNGRDSNVVTMSLGGNPPPITTQPIASGDLISGALTAEDQVVDAGDGTGNSFFFDAYRFHATANTSIAVDLRSSDCDAEIILYQVDSQGRFNFVAFDDQLGGTSDGKLRGHGPGENNDSLLLTVLPTEADYVIFATTSDLDPNGTGSYTLKLTTGAITQLGYGSNFGATIATSDIQTSGGDFLDAYWFFGIQGDNIRLTMTSSSFDSFLILNHSNGDEAAEDDNSAGGVNALISGQLPSTDFYIIIATPLAPSQTGSYNLSLTRLGGLQAENNAFGAAPSSVPGRAAWLGTNNERGKGSARAAARYVIRRDQ